MRTLQSAKEQHLILHDVDWPSYSRLLRVLANRPGVRLTYDRGCLEIMTLSHTHENSSYLLARMVDALTEELRLPVKGGRSTTFRRKRRRRGLEPDACWWIVNEPRVRGKEEIDLRVDPPPDLALEVDITHSSLDRLEIYARLGVPEVWRFDGKVLTFHVLGNDGRYVEAADSKAFPGVRPADLLAFLALRGQADENDILRQFRAWVRQKLAGSAAS